MREILFRGKRLDTGDWVEGLLHYNIVGNNLKLCIQELKFDDGNVCGTSSYAVDPNTIGQWTGLYDHTGRGIFEGDVVESIYVKDGSKGPVKFGQYTEFDDQLQRIHLGWYVNYSDNELEAITPTSLFDQDKKPWFKVVGTIHD